MKNIQTKINNNCGKKGCKIYILPYAATKEAFKEFVKVCVEEQKMTEEDLKRP